MKVFFKGVTVAFILIAISIVFGVALFVLGLFVGATIRATRMESYEVAFVSVVAAILFVGVVAPLAIM